MAAPSRPDADGAARATRFRQLLLESLHAEAGVDLVGTPLVVLRQRIVLHAPEWAHLDLVVRPMVHRPQPSQVPSCKLGSTQFTCCCGRLAPLAQLSNSSG